MAFCKYCGKELPDGAFCTCPSAMHEKLANEEADAANDVSLKKNEDSDNSGKLLYSDTVENSFVHDALSAEREVRPAYETPKSAAPVNAPLNNGLSQDNDDKSLLKFLALILAVMVVFIILLSCFIAGSGFKGTVKKYFNARYSKHGGKTYYSLILPDEGIRELKDEGEWRDIIGDYNDSLEDRMDDWEKKPRFRKIWKTTKMKNSELDSAEKYFFSAALACGADVEEEDIEVKKGYAVVYKYKNTEGDNEKTTIYVVKIKGEGWKVMNGLGTQFFGFD